MCLATALLGITKVDKNVLIFNYLLLEVYAHAKNNSDSASENIRTFFKQAAAQSFINHSSSLNKTLRVCFS
jgi:hypothetical protein